MRFFSYPKVNLFLKIVGTRENYHEINSRFCLVKNIFDTITFVEKQKNDTSFLEGVFSCEVEKNSIYKACKLLQKQADSKKLDDFLLTHKIIVEKQIPEFAGLGGGSSNAATILTALNNIASLGFNKSELAYLGSKIGADVPFFIYGYDNANVSGIGEKVDFFDDEPLKVNLITRSDIKCSTVDVYNTFRNDFLDTIDVKLANTLSMQKNRQISLSYKNTSLNDLLNPALKLYPSLQKEADLGYLFSGSGSTFFKVLDE